MIKISPHSFLTSSSTAARSPFPHLGKVKVLAQIPSCFSEYRLLLTNIKQIGIFYLNGFMQIFSIKYSSLLFIGWVWTIFAEHTKEFAPIFLPSSGRKGDRGSGGRSPRNYIIVQLSPRMFQYGDAYISNSLFSFFIKFEIFACENLLSTSA